MRTITLPTLCGFCAAPLAANERPQDHLVVHNPHADTMDSAEAIDFYFLPGQVGYDDAHRAFQERTAS